MRKEIIHCFRTKHAKKKNYCSYSKNLCGSSILIITYGYLKL